MASASGPAPCGQCGCLHGAWERAGTAVGTSQALHWESACKGGLLPFLVGREHRGDDGRLAAPWLLLAPVSCSPRLATSEAPDAMEEWDVPQMKKEVESLKYQLAFKREMSSKTIPE